MRTALVIVDAWETPFDHDLKLWPNLTEECRAFGEYVNYIAELEHSRGMDIYHDPGRRKVMDNMNLDIATVLNVTNDIPKDYDRYWFCGFHYGRCIHNKINRLLHYSVTPEQIGILFNASMLLYSDKYADYCDVKPNIQNYVWSPNSIEPVTIKFQ